jgi:hypothetical protein
MIKGQYKSVTLDTILSQRFESFSLIGLGELIA